LHPPEARFGFILHSFFPIFSDIFRSFWGAIVPLTRKQKAAVDALATTKTQTEAAEKAGCASRSIRGWLKETEFKNAVLERERELRNEAARIAAIYAVDALNVLHGIIENERNDANLRRLAARDLLNYLHQTETNFDLDIRITRLEVDYENNSKTG
jgi:phage terminase small subunit